jgi:hypothetical protein
VRNPTLHEALTQFTSEAGRRLTLVTSEGEEIPFEVVRDGPLYCYRPLTGDFIRARLGLLTALPSYLGAARALEGVGGSELYLRAHEPGSLPEDSRERVDMALHRFLARVFEERSEFADDGARFSNAYEELERAVYQGRCVTEMIAPLFGLDFDLETQELALGGGLSIVRPTTLTNAPSELTTPGAPALALVLRVAHDPAQRPPLGLARTGFRQVLTALRLYERGGYSIGPLGHWRLDDGPWTPIVLGAGGAPKLLTLIARNSEDELRGFCNMVARRLPSLAVTEQAGAGELGWALSRFEMGCERVNQFESLTDYLLALRALVEPEGPASGRLAQRLAVICAPPEEHALLAERAAQIIALEQAVICGMASESRESEALIDELANHLRAILRDIVCGHLSADVRDVADQLLAQAVADQVAEQITEVIDVVVSAEESDEPDGRETDGTAAAAAEGLPA